jgi:uncharacterized protein (UPF0333 family)
MWKIYLLEAIIVLALSITWAYLIDKNADSSNNDDVEFP